MKKLLLKYLRRYLSNCDTCKHESSLIIEALNSGQTFTVKFTPENLTPGGESWHIELIKNS